MKLIIVNHYNENSPFIKELAYHLNRHGFEIDVLNLIDMYTVSFVNGESQLSKHVQNRMIDKLMKLPKIGKVFRIIYYNLFFEPSNWRSDHTSIHFVSDYYLFFSDKIIQNCKSFSTVVWGSDFNRVTKKTLGKIGHFFRASRNIVVGNNKLIEDFIDVFPDQKDKILTFGFGIGKLDLMKKLEEQKTQEEIKQFLGFPLDKITVTLGYNGIWQQQHIKIIEAIEKAGISKEKIFIAVPFGYGGTDQYKAEVREALKSSGFSYKLYDEYLSDEEVAGMRLGTDLVINAQTTDLASSSIQEHLFAENVVLAGEWLPYEYFSGNGLKFWTFKEEDFSEKIAEIINNFDTYRKQTAGNRQRIHELSSWEVRIKDWVSLYTNS
ncbi:MAG: hypothetical protein WBA74_23585 [Cyclobacteriaceae bacterium]